MAAPTQTPVRDLTGKFVKGKKVTLQRLVNAVRFARAQYALVDEDYKASKTAWEEEMKGVIDERKARGDAKEQAEKMLREEAVNVFVQTGEKNPLPGVSVVENNTLQVTDEQAAFDWLIVHAPYLLSIKTDDLKKAILAGLPIPPHVANVIKVPAGRIGGDV